MSTTPDPGRDRGEQPSGEPEERRTLTERLTGFGRRRHDDAAAEETRAGGAHPVDAAAAGTRTAAAGTPGSATRGSGPAGTATPPRNVATGGGDVDADRGPSNTDNDTGRFDAGRDTTPDTTAERTTVDRPREEDHSHGGTAAAAGGAAGAAAGAAAVRRDDRQEGDAYAAGRADERAAWEGRGSDADAAARDNRYTRREADDRDTDSTDRPVDRRTVVDREREKFGGARIGTGFFGWMAATGLAVLMTALTEAIGTAFGATPATSIPSVTRTTGQTAKTIGWGGTIVLLIIMFLAYLGGGYVAGRMARFNGLRQGLLVWLWGLVVAVVIAAVAHFAGTQYDILGLLNDFPRIPIDVGVTTWGIIALVVVALAGLLGALIGGLWGMSFHRRVDRAGLGR